MIVVSYQTSKAVLTCRKFINANVFNFCIPDMCNEWPFMITYPGIAAFLNKHNLTDNILSLSC